MKSWMTTAAATLALIARAGWAAPVEWPVQAGGNDHHYEAILVPGGITWLGATADAATRGGYLATITSDGENDFVFGLISKGAAFWVSDDVNATGPWLGGFQPAGSVEPAGGWRWVTDEPWTYACWATAEPDNLHGLEDRLHYFDKSIQGLPTWNDVPGSYLLRGYILEIPEPCAMGLLGAGAAAMVMRRRRFAENHRLTA